MCSGQVYYREHMLKPFTTFTAPTYYIIGNHEFYNTDSPDFNVNFGTVHDFKVYLFDNKKNLKTYNSKHNDNLDLFKKNTDSNKSAILKCSCEWSVFFVVRSNTKSVTPMRSYTKVAQRALLMKLA